MTEKIYTYIPILENDSFRQIIHVEQTINVNTIKVLSLLKKYKIKIR
jgi:hypothetical protein